MSEVSASEPRRPRRVASVKATIGMKDDLHAGTDLIKDILSSKDLRKRAHEEVDDAESDEGEADDISHRDKMIIRLEKEVNRSKLEHNEDHDKIEQLKGMIVAMAAALKAPAASSPLRPFEAAVDIPALGKVMYVALNSTTELARSRQVADELTRQLKKARAHIRELESPMCHVCKEPGASVLLHAPLGKGDSAKHMLCVGCLQQLIATNARPLCPLCNAPVLQPQVDVEALRKAKPAAIPAIEPDRPMLSSLTQSEFRASVQHFMRVYNMDVHIATEEAQKKVSAAIEQMHTRCTASINGETPLSEASLAIEDLPNIPARFAGVVEYEEGVPDDY